jgi:hypothetical protein
MSTIQSSSARTSMRIFNTLNLFGICTILLFSTASFAQLQKSDLSKASANEQFNASQPWKNTPFKIVGKTKAGIEEVKFLDPEFFDSKGNPIVNLSTRSEAKA